MRHSFDAATEYCRRIDGHLTSIHERPENDFIVSYNAGHFIGFTYNNSFAWDDNTDLDYFRVLYNKGYRWFIIK